MPVITHQLTHANNHQPGYNVARVLAEQAIRHFDAVRGVGAGIGPGSCCAALAVVPAPQFHAVNGQGFGVAFGNSRVAAGGLDQGPVGNHAERCALTAAGNNGLQLFGQEAVLFVELSPCNGCRNWLGGNGGGVANPFDFGPNGDTLHVWYAFQYPNNNQLENFHNNNLQNQLNIAANW